jgi:hypothetical protein
MKEKQRIITVIVVVILYNIIDQYFIRDRRGLTISSVLISMGIATVLYIALIYFFGRKHMN